MWDRWLPYFGIVYFVYTEFGIYPICSRHAAKVFPLPSFYQILSWKKKEKFLYEVEASNTASLHSNF